MNTGGASNDPHNERRFFFLFFSLSLSIFFFLIIIIWQCETTVLTSFSLSSPLRDIESR